MAKTVSSLKKAVKESDFSEDAVTLAKAAKIIRKDIVNHEGFQFSGRFPKKCQEQSLPSSLKFHTAMVLNGLNLKDQEQHESQACPTIGQYFIFNIKKKSSDLTAKTRHTFF